MKIMHSTRYIILVLALVMCTFYHTTPSIAGTIVTVAGNGTNGYSGDGGAATSAKINYPNSVVLDSAGNLYIADSVNHRIRKVESGTGIITTEAGNGLSGYSGDGGAATSAKLNFPKSVVLDSAGNLYISDEENHRIRKVASDTGIITTVAGIGLGGYSGDGGVATSAMLNYPMSVTLDSAGNLYIGDGLNCRIRRVASGTGIITTVAGNGLSGYSGDGGAATDAVLGYYPMGVTLDSAGNLYITDAINHSIRKVASDTGIITTVAGNGTQGYSGDGGAATSAKLNVPKSVVLDSAGNLYISDGDSRIRKVASGTGIITTVAGNGIDGYSGDGGAATDAKIGPRGLTVDSIGNLYFAGTDRIRKYSSLPIVVGVFSIPANSTLIVPISIFSAADEIAVTGYMVTETATLPLTTDTGWSATAPTSYTFTTSGNKTLYAWAKDAAGNVSASATANVFVDSIIPTVSAFVVPVTSTALTVSITNFTATDDQGVVGLLLTETSSIPLANANSWIATAPTNYTFATSGSKTLYAWAKDQAGNVSASMTASVSIETVVPIVTSFIAPMTSATLTVPVTTFTATDNVAVVGYLLTETSTIPLAKASGWTATAPTNYIFATSGSKTLYAWAKDGAGNVSTTLTTNVLVDPIVPTVSAFVVPATSQALSVSITTFAANDNIGVTGYLLTETSTAPLANASGWTATRPAIYIFATSGSKTLYAWAKDQTGNVSTSATANILVDIAKPVVSAFTLPSHYNNLTVPVASFTATDDSGVDAYLITTSAIAPLVSDSGWSATAPTAFSFAPSTTSGIYTLYAWAKDNTGKISTFVAASVTIDLAVPAVTAFSVASNINSLTVPISTFTAADIYGGVTGYLITESATPPLTGDGGWSATAPTNYTFTTSGNKTLYAWAKDTAGNVSTPLTVSFNLCSIAASSGPNGTLSTPGDSFVPVGNNSLYVIRPNVGYKIADVLVDDVSVGSVSRYLFKNVTVSHTISASFAPDGNANWSTISAGNNHSAAIRSDGTLWSWGTNDVGQVGDGSQTNRTNPVQVGNKTIWGRVSTGNRFTLGHRSDGTLWSWGNNSYGQLGDGTIIGKIIPQQVGLLTTWSSVAAGGLTDRYPVGASNPAFPGHSAALQIDGSLFSWGYNLFGEVGNNSASNATSPVTSGTAGVQSVDISAGANHTVVLRVDGTLWAWGRNDWGQLGVSDQVDKKTATQIGTASDWIVIAAGYEHTLAIKNDGSLWGWGHNDQGQLGVETPAFSTAPILIDNSAIYTTIATGGYHSLAIRNNGTLWAFGSNLEGQLGDGTGATKSYPVQVGFDSDWATVEAGEYHTLALKSNGTMWSWGGNAGGQLGDTTTADRLSPVMIGTNTNNFLIRSSGTVGGNITPLGNVSVSAGTSKAYEIAPLVGYQISDVKIDGVSKGAITGYNFSNVTGNHTIEAIFNSITTTTYSITALAGTGGSITPPGTITVNSGTSQSFTITPLGGYITSDVVVDGASQGATTSYPFSNITANHTISATFAIIADTTLPTISAFSIPTSSNSLSVSVNLTATDNSGTVSSYCLSETNNSATCIWTVQKPATFSFSSTGSKLLYAFVKDPTGNISASSSASTTITLADGTAPIVSAFSIPATSSSLTVTITSLTVNDNVAVAAYLLNESTTTPLLNDSNWNSVKPISYTFSSINQGVATGKTLYAWAKDAAGNISASQNASVTITLSDVTPPTLTSFTLPATSSTLLVPVSTLTATDNIAITAWLLTETPASPSASAAGWSTTKPTSYTFTSAGSKTLYAWAKDGTSNVSANLNSTVTIDTAGPTLTLSTLADGAVTNTATLNVAGTVTDVSGVLSLNINNATVTVTNGSFSYPIVLQTGLNTVTTIATDTVGNITTDIRKVSLDTTAPVLAVSTPTDNSKTAQPQATVSGTISETSTVAVKVNSGTPQNASVTGNAYTATVNLVSGINTITISATDLGGNKSNVIRTITYDNSNPSVAITSPNQDITVNQSGLNISGTVSDTLTTTTVAISFNNKTHNPTVTNGTFSQQLTIPAEGTFAIIATATDEAGNSSSVTRNVIYAAPVNAVCGSSNGKVQGTAPAENLCLTGTATAVTGTGPWNWTCSGSNSGTDAVCAAAIQTYFITAGASGGGSTISCASQVNTGSDTDCTIISASGFQLASLTDNTVDKLSFVTGNKYTIVNVTASHTISAMFIDIQKPVATAFTIPATATSLTVAISTFTATDNTAVTGYCLAETNSSTGCSWAATAPANFTFASAGSKTLYAFTKDAAGNISLPASDSVEISLLPTPINAICGGSNGGTFTVAPTADFCTTGTATAVVGAGPWNWTCSGSNGGTTADCSAAILAKTKPGDCDTNGTVTIAEVQSAINMFLGLKLVQVCVDQDSSGGVSIAEVQKTINSFLGL